MPPAMTRPHRGETELARDKGRAADVELATSRVWPILGGGAFLARSRTLPPAPEKMSPFFPAVPGIEAAPNGGVGCGLEDEMETDVAREDAKFVFVSSERFTREPDFPRTPNPLARRAIPNF